MTATFILFCIILILCLSRHSSPQHTVIKLELDQYDNSTADVDPVTPQLDRLDSSVSDAGRGAQTELVDPDSSVGADADCATQRELAIQRDDVTQHDDAIQRDDVTQHGDAIQRDDVTQHDDAIQRDDVTQHDDAIQRDDVTQHDDAIQHDDSPSQTTRAPQSELAAKHDDSLSDASHAAKRELHHDGAQSVKRVKLAPAQDQRPPGNRVAYSSIFQPHRRRCMLSVCRGGLDPIDLLASWLASLSFQPSGSDAVQYDVLDIGLAALSLQPAGNDAVECEMLDSGLAALSLQPAGNDAVECEMLDSGLAALSLQPAGNDALECEMLDSGLAALSFQPAGSDAAECDVLSAELATLILTVEKRGRDEMEEVDADVDARAYKRVRFSPAPRPERVPHSSWIAPRRRIILDRSRSRAHVSTMGVVVISPSVPAPVLNSTPAPAVVVLQDQINTVSGHNTWVSINTKMTAATGSNGGRVERSKKTVSGRENAAPFTVLSKRKGSLAHSWIYLEFIFGRRRLFLLNAFSMPPLLDLLGDLLYFILFHLYTGPDGAAAAGSSLSDFSFPLSRTFLLPRLGTSIACLDETMLGLTKCPDIYCSIRLLDTRARLELTHVCTHGPYSCLYCLRNDPSLPPPHPSAPGAPPPPCYAGYFPVLGYDTAQPTSCPPFLVSNAAPAALLAVRFLAMSPSCLYSILLLPPLFGGLAELTPRYLAPPSPSFPPAPPSSAVTPTPAASRLRDALAVLDTNLYRCLSHHTYHYFRHRRLYRLPSVFLILTPLCHYTLCIHHRGATACADYSTVSSAPICVFACF
ncbi:hypothetical protein K438DRAFT_1987725 [Mycena galopus ATCC 62051]|nr:hypothetical protein K438DRAFT_1987725 [Mycena galopus ATCC 62051]